MTKYQSLGLTLLNARSSSYIWTAMTDGSERVVSEVGTGWDVESVKLGTVWGQAVQGLVGQLAAGGQVQCLNIAAVGGEAAEGRVAHILQKQLDSILQRVPFCNWAAPDNPWGWGSWGSLHISWPGSLPQFPQCQLGTQTSQLSASLSHPEPTRSTVCSPRQ